MLYIKKIPAVRHLPPVSWCPICVASATSDYCCFFLARALLFVTAQVQRSLIASKVGVWTFGINQ